MIFKGVLRIIKGTLKKFFSMTKVSLFFIVVLITIAENTAWGQSILQEYYNGDKVKMLTDANSLVATPDPVFKQIQNFVPDASDEEELLFAKTNKTEMKKFSVRDKSIINAYWLPSKSNETIIFVHGLKSDASKYLKTSYFLQLATQAEIYAIDLRGHGNSTGKPGDVKYINQYSDDLADIISSIKMKTPGKKIILAGHSMGGGIILRYALGKYKIKVDGYLLFAPHIGHNSPAMAQSKSISKDTTEPFMQLNIQRIIGLKVLNELNQHEQDGLPVLFFNLPAHAPLNQYSYRANMSMAPEDYIDGLKAVKAPMLVLIGDNDEAFNAEQTKKAVTDNSKGETIIIEGATHNGIRHSANSFSIIKNWYQKL